MQRMIQDLKNGETYLFANSENEYHQFTDWLVEQGGKFAYHFETGEGYTFKNKTVEVYGL